MEEKLERPQDIPFRVGFSGPSMGGFNIEGDIRKISGWVWKGLVHPIHWIHTQVEKRQHKKLIQDYFVFRDYVLLRPGAEHPEHLNEVHPDNRDAAKGILSLFAEKNLEGRAELTYDNSEGHRYSFGSPTSTEEIGQIMGILLEGKLVTPFGEPPILFKYVFGERSERKAIRYVGGRLVKRRLTTLFETQTKKEVYRPYLNSNGWLKRDVLVITRFPNLYTTQSYQKELQYVSIAGITGVGTKAGALFISNKKLLDELAKQIKGASCFQALIEVAEIENDKEAQESIPISISLLDTCVVKLDEERIQRWLKTRRNRE